MADLYNTVKKQGEQIDDLQKNVSNHTTRIENPRNKGYGNATAPTYKFRTDKGGVTGGHCHQHKYLENAY